MMDTKELRRLAEAATPGEWAWTIHDHSMASLGVGSDPGSGSPLVLNVSPCRSCREGAKAWEWGKCTTPSEEDAMYIAAASPSVILSLLDEVEGLRKALEDERRALIDAWEVLPGGKQQPVDAVERWLIRDMVPVVNAARAALSNVESK